MDETRTTLEIDYINSRIPLIISFYVMKKTGMIIDTREDIAIIFGNKKKLITT